MAVSSPSTTNVTSTSNGNNNFTPALVVLTSLFFMWGFITCLNDILIPHLQNVFSLSYFESMLIQFCFFFAYFVVSLPSGKLVERIGYKKGIVIGLVTAGIGTLLFYPAAGIRSYPLFLFAFFIMASGITLLQVAANPYVAILGKPETASSRLNLTQAFNSLGTTIAPYFGSLLILTTAVKTADELKNMNFVDVEAYKIAEAVAVQYPYLGLAAVLFLIAAFFAITKLPQIEAASQSSSTGDGGSFDHHHKSACFYGYIWFNSNVGNPSCGIIQFYYVPNNFYSCNRWFRKTYRTRFRNSLYGNCWRCDYSFNTRITCRQYWNSSRILFTYTLLCLYSFLWYQRSHSDI